MSRAFVAASSQYLAFTGGQPVTTYPCTFSCWFKPDTSHNGTLMMVSHGSDGNRMVMYANSGGNVAMASSGSGAAEAVSSTTYTTGEWNHAVGTVTNATARNVLLNGGGSGSNSASATVANCAKYYIGASWVSGALLAGYYFNGEIAHAAVWNVVLTDDEKAALAAGASPLLIRPESLMCYHPMLARSTAEEDWISIFPLTNTGTTAGTSEPRILWPQAQFAQAASGAVAPDAITISTPAAYRIHQRSGTTGTITVTGTYTGSVGPTTIEARLVQDGTSTPLSTFDWSTKVAAPAGGTYSFSFASVPQGGWYNVQVRWSNNTTINATSGKVGVGALVGVVGQSSAYLWFRSRTTATTPNSLVSVYGNIGGWSAPSNATMAGAIGFGNALATELSIPVGLLDYAADGSHLNTNWLPVGGTVNRAFTNGVGALDDKLEAVVWVQGEGDASDGRSQAQYYADLGTLFTDWRTTSFSQASLPIVVATLAKRTVAGYTDAAGQAIYDAQIQKCGDANIYRVDRKDLGMDADGIHHNPAGYEALGARCARAVAYALGEVATYRGPRIASANEVTPGGAAFDVNLTHDMGTDFTPTSSITGFRVLDGGTPATISTVARQTATSIRITLSAAPAAMPVVQYLYGNTPTVTGVVVDNGTLALPLEGTNSSGVPAGTAAPVTATITLVNETGTAQASLSSLKWAWFDEVTPNLFTAPTDQGSAEVTNGSGVLTVTLTGSAKTTGEVGWLIVTNSDGTTSQSPAHRAFSGPVAVD
jgi:hypothetical protein